MPVSQKADFLENVHHEKVIKYQFLKAVSYDFHKTLCYVR